MCGIAGIIGPGQDGRGAMDRMLSTLRHRGPDDQGVYQSPDALLGQRRLSIIDLSGGHQPIANEDQTMWIVCNGEIYNYRELRRDLIDKGHCFRTHSDSEVILHLYEEFGEGCLTRLRGMFAFAIWDQNNRTLFAARDHFGQKPLFYVQRGQQLWFASEIKSLLTLDPSLSELNPQALDQYLTLRVIAPPLTMFREIRKLPPAHALRFSATGGARCTRYWNLHYEPKWVQTEDELVDELEEHLIETLRLHMVSDVPVGAFMSGGLDSTLLVAMLMKHVASEPIHTFTIGLPYRESDESPYARMISDQYGTQHHERIFVPSVADSLATVLWHLDEPADPLSVCTFAISKMASEHVKVAIGGDGGDELFGGYDRYYGNRAAGDYAKIPRVIRTQLISPILNRIGDGGWYKSKAHQLKWIHRLSFLQGGERYAASLNYFYFDSASRARMYGPVMREAARGLRAEAAIEDPYNQAIADDVLDRMLYADATVRLPNHSVTILDRMSMAHSLEARSPFLDHTLAEFAARVPPAYKVPGRTLRYLQVKLAQRYLPKALLQRPKQGFSSALPYLLRAEYGRLYAQYLTHAHLARDGLLSQSAIDHLLNEHRAGKRDHGNRLWLILHSEAWYRMFIDRESIGQPCGEGMELSDTSAVRKLRQRLPPVAEATPRPPASD